MLVEYVNAALERAHYEKIEDEEPYYGEVPGLQGVWATGRTIEDCRRRLISAMEDWILLSASRGLPVPPMGEITIELPRPVS